MLEIQLQESQTLLIQKDLANENHWMKGKHVGFDKTTKLDMEYHRMIIPNSMHYVVNCRHV